MQNPKLAARLKEYAVPPLPHQPIFNFVTVFRIPPLTKHGSIFVPENVQRPKPQGLLVAAGMKARDEFESNGVLLGDLIWFAKYAGWEEEIDRDPNNQSRELIFLEAKEIRGSEDLIERLESPSPTTGPRMEIVQGPDGRYCIKVIAKTARKAA